MRTIFRYIRRALAALAILLALCAIALLIVTHTSKFNNFLRTKAVAWLAQNYRGRFTIGRMEGSIWTSIALDDVVISYRGRPVAEIPRVEVNYSLTSLIWRVLHLTIAAEAPRVNLMREPDGQWNLLEALAERAPSPGPSKPLPVAIDLDDLSVSRSAVAIAPRGDSGPHYALSNLALNGSLQMAAAGIRAELRKLAMAVAAPGMPPARLQAALAYQDQRRPATVVISAADLSTRDSAVSMTGRVRESQPMRVDATVAIQNLAAADVARIYPASPLIANLSGTVKIAGPENALHADAALNAAGATIHAIADTNLTRTPTPYSARVRLQNLAIAKLARVAAAGVLNGKISASGTGANLGAATAKVELHGRGMAAGKYDLGAVELTAALAQGSGHADIGVNGPAGNLTLAGDSSVNANPRYRLTLAGRHLNLARLGAGRASDINLNAALDGQGIKPATMDTRLTGTIAGSRVETLTLTRGAFDVRIANDRADIRNVSLTAIGAVLDASGFAGLAKGAPIRLTYRLRARDIAPILKLANRSGGGRLNLGGEARGSLAELRTQGVASLDSVHLAAYSVDRGEIRYNLAATGPGAPYGEGKIALSGVKAGVGLRTLTSEIRASRGASHTFAVSLNVTDNTGRHDSAAADFTMRPGIVTGHLTRLGLQVPSGDWSLAAPVDFRRDPRGITLTRMELKSGPHEILAEGTLALSNNPQNFQIIASRLDFAALHPLAPQYGQLGGTFSVRLSVAGTPAAPNLYLELNARGMRARSHPIGDLSAVIKYQPDSAAIDAVLRQRPDNVLTVSGTVPISLQWANGFKANVRDGIDLRVNAPRLDLAQLSAFIPPSEVRDFQGVASIDLALRGSITHPAPTGAVKIAGVKGEIVPLGVKISEMHAAIGVDPQEIRVATLEVRSGGGAIHGAGAIGLNAYMPETVALTFKFDQWPAIHTQQYRATIGGDIAAGGSFTHPRVTGAIAVLNATIIPDLAFLTSGRRYAPDETITVIQPGENVPLPENAAGPGGRPSLAPPPPAPSPPHASAYNNLDLDVAVTIHRNTWIRHEYAVAELEGHLRIEKRPRGPVTIIGAIHTVRGWIDYQNRRFELQTGEISFTGGSKIDPSLNIDARYNISNYMIDVLIGGTADKPTLRLTSVPELSQADILSLILFGKTTSALGQGQQADLQQQAAKMAAGFAASQIGQAVASSMGLQSLGLQLSDIGTSGGSVGIGHYLGENTYVSASQTIGAGATSAASPNVANVSVQYFITHWLSITTKTASDGSHEIDLSIIKQY